jgi:hypothetical protein
MPRCLAVSTLLALSAAVAHADNWPAWRGPTGQGLCFEKNLPVTWSATENVKWKIPPYNSDRVKGEGNAAPDEATRMNKPSPPQPRPAAGAADLVGRQV